MKRLRLAQVHIQPVLVWDDGDNLTAGPEIETKVMSLAQAIEFLNGLPSELLRLAEQLTAEITPKRTSEDGESDGL